MSGKRIQVVTILRVEDVDGPEWIVLEDDDEFARAGCVEMTLPYVRDLLYHPAALSPLGEHPGPSSHQPADARDKPKHHSVRDRREV